MITPVLARYSELPSVYAAWRLVKGIGVLIALLLPAIFATLHSGRRVICVSGIKQILVAVEARQKAHIE
jgi:hypothetical protein